MDKKFSKLRLFALTAPIVDWRWTSRGLRSNQLGSDVFANELFGIDTPPPSGTGKVHVKIGSVWVLGTPYVKVVGTWTAAKAYSKQGGAWGVTPY